VRTSGTTTEEIAATNAAVVRFDELSFGGSQGNRAQRIWRPLLSRTDAMWERFTQATHKA